MNINESRKAKLTVILCSIVWGTIGIFRKFIDMPSSSLVMCRGFLAAAFIFLYMRRKGIKISYGGNRKNLVLLIITGALIGINWMTLFESYNYTTVAVATLCYYMQPIFLIIASVIIFREKLSLKKAVCVLIAAAGMVLVSGVLKEGFTEGSSYKGVLLGLLSGVLYGAVIILNKFLSGIDPYSKTFIQLLAAAIVVLPYVMLTGDWAATSFTLQSTILIIIVSIVHTGIAYTAYFGAVEKANIQSVALFGYLDPVTACILSQLILGEQLGASGIIGAILIIGAAIVSEL